MSEHTPGPWTLKLDYEQSHIIGAQIIGSTVGPLGHALPLGYIDSRIEDAYLAHAARAALAKARGE